MAIYLHLLNVHGKLNQWQSKIEQVFAQSVKQMQDTLPLHHQQIDVVVKVSDNVIEELGIGGYSPSQYELEISIAPQHAFLSQNFTHVFRAILAHEMHHCCRHASVGYGDTLFQALISEGLACHYEREFSRQTPIYVNHLSPQQRQQFLTTAEKVWFGKNYNHASWFFGSVKERMPKWVGYDLGYFLVEQYLNQTAKTAGCLVNEPAESFLPSISQ